MTVLSRRFGFLAGAIAVAVMCGNAQAAVFSVKAVKINNVDIAPTDTVEAMPGDRVIADVFVRDWESDAPGTRVKSYQVLIAGAESFFLDMSLDFANVAQPGCSDIPSPVKCEQNIDCTGAPDTPICDDTGVCKRECIPDQNPALPDDECTASFPLCNAGRCVGVNHEPDACSFVDSTRGDWIFESVANQSPVSACSFLGLNIACGAVIINGIPPLDPGTEVYVGTIAIDLTSSACGSIVPAISTGADSFLLVVPGEGTVFPTAEDLTINVVDDQMAPVSCVACPVLVDDNSTIPPNCTIDARQPNSLASGNPAFWFNNTFDFVLNFSAQPKGGFLQSDFSIDIVPSQPGPIIIDGFSTNGTQVTVSVTRPPSFTGGGRWLCIDYEDSSNPSCEPQRACWARLPGDVNGDLDTASDDLTALISDLNQGNLPNVLCDMDRSGACRAPDILSWIDIANGAGALLPFLGISMDPCPSAP